MGLSIVILAVLLATVCNGEQSSGANNFLKSKWKSYFKIVNVNHDSVLSMTDLDEARRTFSELYHSNQYDSLDKFWNECVMRGNTVEVTKSEFIATYDQDFTMDHKEFVNLSVQCQELIYYDIIDANEDRLISQEEYNIILKVFGNANDALNAKFFQSYDPVDNLLPLQTLIDSWVDFETNEDASKGNNVKTFPKGKSGQKIDF